MSDKKEKKHQGKNKKHHHPLAPDELKKLLRKPYKSSPCKGCPALSGGKCKCALKRLG